jgi:hypothetical protein
MIRLPNPSWVQANSSDKFGNLSATRCVNLDQDGYVKLSSRAFSVYSEDASSVGFDTTVTRILSIGRYGEGDFTAVTSDANQDIELSKTLIDGTEDEVASNPSTTNNSWGTFWQNRWYVSTATTVIYKAIASGAAGAWTTGIITGLTSGVTHALDVFRNKQSLAVTDGNTVKLYDTSHTLTATLTLPSDFEAVGIAYSNYRMGVITRMSSALEGQGSDAYFFVWDGGSSQATTGIPIGSDCSVAIVAYKGSWVILTRTGQLLFFNGGGFQELGAFPFYYTPFIWGDFINKVAYGNIMWVDGDVIYINVSFNLDQYGKYLESHLPYCPSGVWAYDPKNGLYHRYAPSFSQMRIMSVTSANVNTTTNILTTSDAVPPTGSMVRYSNASGTPIGGLKEYHDYYVIYLTSATLSLATSYENALAGVAIDLTSTGASNNYFLAFDIRDYNSVDTVESGAITGTGTYDLWGDHIIFGSSVYDHDSTSAFNHFMVSVPDMENRGYFVTPKIFSQGTTDTQQKFIVRHKPLQSTDAIIIKEKSRDVFGLPTSTRRATSGVSWTSQTAFSTTSDIEDVYNAFNAGHEIECEIISGAASGVLVQIESIAYESGTYAVTLKETVPYTGTGKISQVQFDNYRVVARVDENNQNDGCIEASIGKSSKWSMYKVELRGVNTTIEDVSLVSVPHKQAL